MNRFEGKSVLVTGGASGIGRATAQRFAAEGARVSIGDISAAGLEETRASLAGGGHHVQLLDVADPAACRAGVAAAAESLGGLDVLCNVAGIGCAANFTDIGQAQWDRMVAVNLSGVFHMCQAAMPHLLQAKGNIVNVASTAALVGQAYNSMYCATKGGVLLLSKALAVEYASRGVRVNAICPGGVKTPLSAAFRFPEGADMALVSRLMPLVESAEPAEIAAAIAYLASPEARFVTGEALVIDGAQTAS